MNYIRTSEFKTRDFILPAMILYEYGEKRVQIIKSKFLYQSKSGQLIFVHP